MWLPCQHSVKVHRTAMNAALHWCPTDLRDEFRLFSPQLVAARANAAVFFPTLQSALLSKPMQMMLLQGRHTTKPLRAPLPKILANHNACRHPNPLRWQVRAPPGNPLGVSFGAFWVSLGSAPAQCADCSALRRWRGGKYDKRQRRPWEWIESLISFFIWVSRGLDNKGRRLFFAETCIVGEIVRNK